MMTCAPRLEEHARLSTFLELNQLMFSANGTMVTTCYSISLCSFHSFHSANTETHQTQQILQFDVPGYQMGWQDIRTSALVPPMEKQFQSGDMGLLMGYELDILRFVHLWDNKPMISSLGGAPTGRCTHHKIPQIESPNMTLVGDV